MSGRSGRNHLDLVSKVLTQGQSRSADGAEHVPAVGDFLHPHLFAEANFAKLATSGAFYLLDLKLTTDRSLTQGQGGITFEIEGERIHGSGVSEALLRLARNNKRRKRSNSFLSLKYGGKISIYLTNAPLNWDGANCLNSSIVSRIVRLSKLGTSCGVGVPSSVAQRQRHARVSKSCDRFYRNFWPRRLKYHLLEVSQFPEEGAHRGDGFIVFALVEKSVKFALKEVEVAADARFFHRPTVFFGGGGRDEAIVGS